jgi:hypothetical protein
MTRGHLIEQGLWETFSVEVDQIPNIPVMGLDDFCRVCRPSGKGSCIGQRMVHQASDRVKNTYSFHEVITRLPKPVIMSMAERMVIEDMRINRMYMDDHHPSPSPFSPRV